MAMHSAVRVPLVSNALHKSESLLLLLSQWITLCVEHRLRGRMVRRPPRQRQTRGRTLAVNWRYRISAVAADLPLTWRYRINATTV